MDWQVQTRQYFNTVAGREAYKLLGFLAMKLKMQTIVDIGTLYGFSALALSLDDTKSIISYDIHDSIDDEQLTAKNRSNIEFRIMDCLEDMDTVCSANLIFLDIDHSGYYEMEIVKMLERHKYKGILVIDNINATPGMKALWLNIKQTKYDVTAVGHWSGTGIDVFDYSKYRFEI